MPVIEYSERSEMKTVVRTIVLIVLVLADIANAYADEPEIPKALHALIVQGIDLTLRQQYDRADSVIQIATERYPQNPLGYLYQAGVMEAKSMDYLDPLNFGKFDSLLAIARTQAQKIVDRFPRSPLGHYYLGTAIGYDAYAQVDAGNWFAGILKGLSAASEFQKSMSLDSSFYDAYVGVGTYFYWKSRKMEFLNWMLGDRRAEGIRLLEIAADKADYNRFTALSVLTAIYLDTGQYKLSEERADRALDYYPENRIFLGELAEAQEQSGNYAGTLATYKRLLVSILAARIANPYGEIACRMHIVRAQLALKETQGIDTQIEAILAFENRTFPDALKARAKDKFEQAKTIRKELAAQ